jgi:hypothetical protein
LTELFSNLSSLIFKIICLISLLEFRWEEGKCCVEAEKDGSQDTTWEDEGRTIKIPQAALSWLEMRTAGVVVDCGRYYAILYMASQP